jgi:hypothetical protein
MNFLDIPTVNTPNSIETVSGLYVDVANPDPKTILINDVAWATSRLARFAGHTLSEEIWSIAQHAMFVEYLVDLVMSEDGVQLHWSLTEWLMSKGLVGEYRDGKFSKQLTRMHALIHDAPEAYLVDMPTPVKRHPLIQAPYKELEGKMEQAILIAFNLPAASKLEHEIVKWADMLALRIETACLIPSRGRGWGIVMPRMNHVDMYLMPKVKHWKLVCHEFLERYEQLHLELNPHMGAGLDTASLMARAERVSRH